MRRLRENVRRAGRTASLTAVSLIVLLAASTTYAFLPWVGTWPGGNFSYRINVTSFQNNLSGLSLSQAETEYFVPQTLNTWRDRTGVGNNLTFTYNGTSTASNQLCQNFDGSNQVYAVTGCLGGGFPPCATWAMTQPRVSGSNFVETDICVYGDSVGTDLGPGNLCDGSWRVLSNSFPAGDKDLLGVLTHEFGHALGLDHTANTVMDSPTFSCGDPLARFQYGDDIDGIRSLYGIDTTRVRQWREMTSTTWSSDVAIPGSAYSTPHASVGRRGSSQTTVVATRTDDDGAEVHFTSAIYPISSSSTWTDIVFTGNDSWNSPAIAGRPPSYSTNERWVAAWNQRHTLATDCDRLRVATSTNGFSTSMVVTDFDQHCGSLQEPAVAFDPNSGRFIVVYVRHKQPSGDMATVGEVNARTSTDGTNWTNPQDLNFWSLGPVDIACASDDGDCTLTWIRGTSQTPEIVSRAITVSSGGTITIGNATYGDDLPPWAPSAGIRTYSSANEWLMSRTATTCATHGSCSTSYDRDASIPVSSFSWSTFSSASESRVTFASNPESVRIYGWHSF